MPTCTLAIMQKIFFMPPWVIQSYAPNVRPKLKTFLKMRRHVKASTAISPVKVVSDFASTRKVKT